MSKGRSESFLGRPPKQGFLVAFSGGADSTALLLMAHENAPGRVRAVHVHHGLQEAADDFAEHCTVFCAAIAVPLTVLKVNARAKLGQSPEDAARQARYKAIAQLALAQHRWACDDLSCDPTGPTVLLGQHTDDQVETMLLALSRGAGVDGLAAMSAQFERLGVRWARPFLLPNTQMDARAVRRWLSHRGLIGRQPGHDRLGLGWVEDPSNQHTTFTRNRIRAELMPVLERVFPRFRQTFGRTARNMAHARMVMEEAAENWVGIVGLPPSIKALQTLGDAQQINYLRHWFKQCNSQPSEAQLRELTAQIAACQTRGHQIDLAVAGGKVVRMDDRLSFERGHCTWLEMP